MQTQPPQEIRQGSDDTPNTSVPETPLPHRELLYHREVRPWIWPSGSLAISIFAIFHFRLAIELDFIGQTIVTFALCATAFTIAVKQILRFTRRPSLLEGKGFAVIMLFAAFVIGAGIGVTSLFLAITQLMTMLA